MKRQPPMIVPALVDDLGLSAAAFRIYAHLCRRANGNGECWPAAPSIAETCRLHRDTVWRALAELEAAGLVIRTKGVRNSNRYAIVPLASVGGKGGLTDANQSAENEGRLSPGSEGRHPAEKEGHQSAEKEGRKGYPSKEVQRRESTGGSGGTLSSLPESLSETETVSASQVLRLRADEVPALYREFRTHKNAFPKDWQHLHRQELCGNFTTWLTTSRPGKELLKRAQPQPARNYSVI
jgi:hypothetical protein